MKLYVRIAAISIAIVVFYAGLLFSLPQTSREWGLDVWNCSVEERKLAAGLLRRKEIELAHELIIQIALMKSEIIQDLVDGKITFVNASEQFFVLNRSQPELLRAIKRYYPSLNEMELNAMQVIYHLQGRSHSDKRIEPNVLNLIEIEFGSLSGPHAQKASN